MVQYHNVTGFPLPVLYQKLALVFVENQIFNNKIQQFRCYFLQTLLFISLQTSQRGHVVAFVGAGGMADAF